MGKIITIAMPKGGVGKTATAVNLAASLAVLEKKTLLIDFDPSGTCATSLGIKQSEITSHVFQIFSFAKSIDQTIVKTTVPNLEFIPAISIGYEDEEKVERVTKNLTVFRNILQRISDDYDYIIIDTPPYLRGLSTIALIASQSVIIPVRGDHMSIVALNKIMRYIKAIKERLNFDLLPEGILFTMYERNTRAWKITVGEIFRKYGREVFTNIIPKSTFVSESSYYGKPAVIYNPSSRASSAYLSLAYEIIVRNKICPLITELNRSS